jgi:hypothetical protein
MRWMELLERAEPSDHRFVHWCQERLAPEEVPLGVVDIVPRSPVRLRGESARVLLEAALNPKSHCRLARVYVCAVILREEGLGETWIGYTDLLEETLFRLLDLGDVEEKALFLGFAGWWLAATGSASVVWHASCFAYVAELVLEWRGDIDSALVATPVRGKVQAEVARHLSLANKYLKSAYECGAMERFPQGTGGLGASGAQCTDRPDAALDGTGDV